MGLDDGEGWSGMGGVKIIEGFECEEDNFKMDSLLYWEAVKLKVEGWV